MFKEIAINLKDWEVNAILKGRKTQMRRVIKSPATSMQKAGMKVIQYRLPGDPWYKDYVWSMRGKTGVWGDYTHSQFIELSPYQVGNWLWVREPFRIWESASFGYHGEALDPDILQGPLKSFKNDFLKSRPREYRADDNSNAEGPWRSSSTMPRWASRITLEVTSVRVERVQDISEEDAKAEGIYKLPGTPIFELSKKHPMAPSAKDAFCYLWESLHGPGAWDRNDWVWVYEFKRINQ